MQLSASPVWRSSPFPCTAVPQDSPALRPVPRCSQGRYCSVPVATGVLLREPTRSSPTHGKRSHRLRRLGCPGAVPEAARQAAWALVWFEAPSPGVAAPQALWDQGDPHTCTRPEADARGRVQGAAPAGMAARACSGCCVPCHPLLPTEEGHKPTPLTSTSRKGFPCPVETDKHVSRARNPHLGCQGHVPTRKARQGIDPLRH